MKSKWLPWAIAGLLLVLLIVALYSSGKCPRRCYFPEFCEELAIPMPKDGVLPAPVTMEREVACPYGGFTRKYYVKLYWDESWLLVADYEERSLGYLSSDKISLVNTQKNTSDSSPTIHQYVNHVSYATDCGRHDFLVYIVPDLKSSKDGTVMVKVGIGNPPIKDFYWAWGGPSNQPSVWDKALSNVRYAFTGPDELDDELPPHKRLNR